MALPTPPARDQDPWYDERSAFDLAIKERLDGDLSPEVLTTAIVTEVGGSGRTGAVWTDAWEAKLAGLLREWFRANTGPRIPVDYDTPLTGEVTVANQAQADALRGRLIDGHVLVTSPGLTLCDFVVRGDGSENLIGWTGALNALRFHHIEIDGQFILTTNRAISGSGGNNTLGNHVVEFCNIHSTNDALYARGGSVLRYNWIHDPILWPRDGDGTPYDPETDPHSDGIQGSGGSNIRIQRNFIEYLPALALSSNIISCIILNPTTQPIANVLIEENYIAGGNNSIRLVDPGSGQGDPTGVIIRKNMWGGGFSTGLISHGPTAPTIEGNFWAQDGVAANVSGALAEVAPPREDDPLAVSYVSTFLGIGGAQVWGSANDARYLMALTPGAVGRIALHVVVSSGNISVGVYRGSRGRFSKKPLERLAFATVACPTVGIAYVELDKSVEIQAGDYLALSCDNATASFIGFTGTASPLYGGQFLQSPASFPLPEVVPETVTYSGYRMPILAGRR